MHANHLVIGAGGHLRDSLVQHSAARRQTTVSSLSRWLCAAVAVSLVLTSCSRGEAAPANTPTPVAAAPSAPSVASPAKVTAKLAMPEKIMFQPRIQATGSLKALQSATLAFPVSGTLDRLQVARGQHVTQGAVLAALDASAARASLSQAEAGVAAAEAQLRLAEDSYRRFKAIREEDGISEAQLFQSKSQRDTAAAQVLGAKAQLEQARVLLRNHTLRAPFAGLVIRVPDGVGSTVTSETSLFAIESTRSLILDTSVTQEEAAELREGLIAQVTVPATGEMTPRPDARGAVAAAKARIRVVVASVDPATNRVPIEIDVPNPDAHFKPHALARAEILGVEREAWRVPSSVLTQSDSSFAAWTLGQDGKVHAVRVRVLGEKDGGQIVVPTGTSWSGELKLVEAPPLGLSEGAELTEVATR